MGDTPDKRRPWVMRHCPYCDFQSDAEWAWLRHMEETGHPFPVLGPQPAEEAAK